MDVLDTPAARLAAALGARGITRARLAALLGVNAGSLSRLMNRGEETPRVSWARVGELLGVPPECFAVGGPRGPLVGMPV